MELNWCSVLEFCGANAALIRSDYVHSIIWVLYNTHYSIVHRELKCPCVYHLLDDEWPTQCDARPQSRIREPCRILKVRKVVHNGRLRIVQRIAQIQFLQSRTYTTNKRFLIYISLMLGGGWGIDHCLSALTLCAGSACKAPTRRLTLTRLSASQTTSHRVRAPSRRRTQSGRANSGDMAHVPAGVSALWLCWTSPASSSSWWPWPSRLWSFLAKTEVPTTEQNSCESRTRGPFVRIGGWLLSSLGAEAEVWMRLVALLLLRLWLAAWREIVRLVNMKMKDNERSEARSV